MLQDGTCFPGHWWNIVSASRLARRDLVAARAAIANALLYTEAWSPRGLALMYQWFEASGAGADTLAVVYHGAAAWAFDVKGKDYLGWKSLPKPSRLKTRFAPIFAEWVREVWPASRCSTAASSFTCARCSRRSRGARSQICVGTSTPD